MSLPYGPPYPVSPLIRGSRYAFLILGIFYARVKQKIYDSMEKAYQDEEAEKQVIIDIQLKKLKEKIAAEEREIVKLLESGKLFEMDTD